METCIGSEKKDNGMDLEGHEMDKEMEWIKETESKPPFGELVLVYCRIYGRFLASYEFIGDFGGEKYGNWKHDGKLGILPPVLWMKIPEIPEL